MKMTSIKWALSISAAAVLVACGGGGEEIKVASANTAVAINPAAAATVTAAVAAAGATGIAVTVPAAVPTKASDGSTVNIPSGSGIKLSSTTVAGAAAAFTITEPAGAVTGNFKLGSCIFEVTAAPAGSNFKVGSSYTVDPCSLNVATNGVVADNTPKTVQVNLVLGTISTSGSTITGVAISAAGAVTIGSAPVGTATVTNRTGA